MKSRSLSCVEAAKARVFSIGTKRRETKVQGYSESIGSQERTELISSRQRICPKGSKCMVLDDEHMDKGPGSRTGKSVGQGDSGGFAGDQGVVDGVMGGQ